MNQTRLGLIFALQAEGIEQVNDRCKLVRRQQVAPQRALEENLQSFAMV